MARRFSFGLSNGLNVGLENEEVQQTEAQDTATQTEVDAAGANTVETELLEVNDAVEEGAQREQAIDQADAAMDELEEDAEAVAVAAENGGLDRAAADFLKRKVAFHMESLGMTAPRMPATESFGGPSSRLGATQVALEGVAQALKDIWNAIINTIKKAVGWVKGLFNKVFGAYEALAKRAKAVADKAGNTTGRIDNDKKKFENDRLHAALEINGKVDQGQVLNFFTQNASKIFAGLVDQSTEVEKITERLNDFDPTAGDLDTTNGGAATAKVNEVLGGTTVAAQLESKATSFMGLTLNDLQSGDKRITEGYVTKRSTELPGNRAYFYRKGSDNALSSFRTYLGAFDEKRRTKEGVQLDTWQAAQCETLAEAVADFADEAIKSRKDLDKLAESKEKMVKAVERLSSRNWSFDAADVEGTDASANNAAKSGNATVREIRKAVLALNKLGTELPVQAVQYGVQVGKAALDYCEISLKNHSAA